MDGIHDMGGMHGFGRVEPEADEPVFHAPWGGPHVRPDGRDAPRAAAAPDPSAWPSRRSIRDVPCLELLRAVGPGGRGSGRRRRQPHARGDRRACRHRRRTPVRSEAIDPDLVVAVPAFLDAPQEPSGEAVPPGSRSATAVTMARIRPGPPPVPPLRARRHRRGGPGAGRVAAAGGGGRPRGDLHRALRHARRLGRRRRAGLPVHRPVGAVPVVTAGPHRTEPSPIERRVAGLESLLVERGLITSDVVDAVVETYEHDVGPLNGARVVARAWVDDDYRAPAVRRHAGDRRAGLPAAPRASTSWCSRTPRRVHNRGVHPVLVLPVAGARPTAELVQELGPTGPGPR